MLFPQSCFLRLVDRVVILSLICDTRCELLCTFHTSESISLYVVVGDRGSDGKKGMDEYEVYIRHEVPGCQEPHAHFVVVQLGKR